MRLLVVACLCIGFLYMNLKIVAENTGEKNFKLVFFKKWHFTSYLIIKFIEQCDYFPIKFCHQYFFCVCTFSSRAHPCSQ